ncbi:S9 family peptidase [Rickettsia endosymbiont of Halotydeus destructor]|uniref:S9 family peptidase n=1 Tax=Rickettsia endosymbiont of Halotydeus destructor TaxID=2996754 RepID=UPI003BB08294
MKPPIADKQSFSFDIHGQKISDDYHWLRDPKWPEVQDPKILEYLKEENKYTKNFFADLQNEKEKIFEELKSRIKLDDISTYTKKENYYYYHKTEADKNYPIYCRKHGTLQAQEEIILDVNLLAKNNKFTQVGSVAISPDQNLMAYSVDFNGDEKYDIRIFDLKAQKYLPDEIKGISGAITWHEKLNGFFYVTINEKQRPDKIMFHRLGENPDNDKLIFHVKNPLHFVSTGKSSSRKYIFIHSGDHNEDEVYIISMQDASFTPKLLRAAQNNIFYDIDHNGDYFYIKTNLGAKNFRITRVKIDNLENINWDDNYIKEEKDKYLKSFDITNNYLILNYRDQGLPLIKVKNLKDSTENNIHFPDSAFEASSYSTNFDEDDIRVNYSSLARPATTYSYDFNNDKLSILKVQEIPSGFNPDEYQVERIFADNENVRVPITLLYKKSLFKKDGSNPLYLYGYGSYGINMPAAFRNTAISIADRGFVYALAHIRGGDDLGHDWYEAAKFLNKKRTFEDFIRATETLIKEKYTSKGNIVIAGGSAGGMLIGYVINEKPELYKVAIAHVPFVDVLNTMLDESLPLTLLEYKEWGNPKELEYFNYIKSYSPYDNVKPQNYPALFVICGLSDPRVGYWEAAKWVARLRDSKTDDNILLLKTNMEFGHQGASGRFDYLKEAADELVFIFKIFGK